MSSDESLLLKMLEPAGNLEKDKLLHIGSFTLAFLISPNDSTFQNDLAEFASENKLVDFLDIFKCSLN
jgi:hypothetical protein